ncbi:hypothetical protein [Haloferax massiliensis]|uniref:hypothetical protein n=1 Tax=Haloferax massiliensis TaxID=1476858 RepID=UPI000A5B28B2|nr:hypothetical protein [Haloferax massiliensis]
MTVTEDSLSTANFSLAFDPASIGAVDVDGEVTVGIRPEDIYPGGTRVEVEGPSSLISTRVEVEGPSSLISTRVDILEPTAPVSGAEMSLLAR